MTPSGSAATELLIVGAGPAGLSAALAAAPSGIRITILDDNSAPGGQIWRDGPGAKLPTQALKLRDAVSSDANVHVSCATRVVGVTGPRALLLDNGVRAWSQHFDKLILCTGARELLLPFPGWTLPGVTGAGGLQALVKAGLSIRGERVVVAGSGPLLLAAAATARKAGARVVRVAEQASLRSVAAFAASLIHWPGKIPQAISLANPQYRTSTHVIAAEGDARLDSVRLQTPNGPVDIACDRLACGFGLVPNTELGQLLGCSLRTHAGMPALDVDATQATSVASVYAAGECIGFGGSEAALVEGAIAGHAAVGNLTAARALQAEGARWDAFADGLGRRFALRDELKVLARADTLICRCEDVPLSALAGSTGWTDAKLHSRCGMGACQGRVCGAAAQFTLGWTPPAPRTPLSPVRMGHLAALSTSMPERGDRGQTQSTVAP